MGVVEDKSNFWPSGFPCLPYEAGRKGGGALVTRQLQDRAFQEEARINSSEEGSVHVA